MTSEEFAKQAAARGISQPAIEKQIAVYKKFMALGLKPTSFEDILAAHDKGSCLEAFESALGH